MLVEELFIEIKENKFLITVGLFQNKKEDLLENYVIVATFDEKKNIKEIEKFVFNKLDLKRGIIADERQVLEEEWYAVLKFVNERLKVNKIKLILGELIHEIYNESKK